MKPFKQINTSDRILATVQNNIQDVTKELQSQEELNAKYLSITFPSANQDLIVPHMLSRNYKAYNIAEAFADIRIWTSSTVNKFPNKQIILQASAPGTITLKIY